MTTHIATLIDRFAREDGRLIIRAQMDSGRVLDVYVLPEHREEAARIWGGGTVRFAYRGGRAFYAPRPAGALTRGCPSGW